MNRIKYLLYDTDLNINTKKIKVEHFKYKDDTLVKDFKRHLLIKYYSLLSEEVLSFKIITTFDTYYIEFENTECKLKDFFREIDTKNIILIVPCLPEGGTIARFDCFRIVIHSNEENHRNMPHIHIIKHDGGSMRIRLIDLKPLDKNILPKKIYKNIYDYLEKNRDYLIKMYDEIVNHKEIEKFVIDIYNNNMEDI